MGQISSPPPTALSSRGLISGLTINALGDSINDLGLFFPATTSLASVPVWQANFNYAAAGFGVGTAVTNNGLLYRLTVAGTSAGSGGPTTQAQSGITDNTCTWAYVPFQTQKTPSGFLYWAEIFSLGALKWDQTQGYSGIINSIVKIIVVNGGTGYAAGVDTITLTNGAQGTLNIVGGVIRSVTITNPSAALSGLTYTINTSTGSGAVLSLVAYPSGTFGTSGCSTGDMVARLPDVVASTVDIVVVCGGTNDITAGGTYATITANLKNCYETLLAAGKRVVAVPVTPRGGGGVVFTTPQSQVAERVNTWIRNYTRKFTSANPSNVNIVLADFTRYWTDGTLATNQPIGTNSAGNGAMTLDGLHFGSRGGMYAGIVILTAVQHMVTLIPQTPSRIASLSDGYHAILHPGGNYLEGQPWPASTSVSLGTLCSNNSNVYICSVAGLTNSSGGPSGTGTGIVDNTAQWNFVRAAGSSIFGSGTQAIAALSGLTTTGVTDKSWAIFRAGGSSSGTCKGWIENPWSDSQNGTRQCLAFNLSAGTNTDGFGVFLWNNSFAANDFGNMGILQADLGVTQFFVESELELSAAQNVTSVGILVEDSTANYGMRNQFGMTAYTSVANSVTLMNSTNEMLPFPSNGKIFVRSSPFVIPASPVSISTLRIMFAFAFDSTVSASLVVKFNHFALRKWNVS